MTRTETPPPKRRTELGRAIVKLRTDRGLTQRELAARLQVDPSYLSRIEGGHVGIPSDFTDRLVDALGLSWDEQVLISPLSSEPLYPDPGTLYAAIELVRMVSLGGLGGRVLRQMGVDVLEKRAIAKFVAKGIDLCCAGTGASTPILLESGSTCAYIAHTMAMIAGGNWSAFTNNLLAAIYLLDVRDVLLLGGRVDREFAASMGSETFEQLEELVQNWGRDRTRWATPLGLFSCLAFSSDDGPFARRVDPVHIGTSSAPTSRHLRIKQLMAERIPEVVLVVTSEKLVRMEEERAVWADVVAPLSEGEPPGPWNTRLENPDMRTHVVLSMPRDSTRGARHVYRAAEALQSHRHHPFVLTSVLLDKSKSEGRLLTVVDGESGDALREEDLERVSSRGP